MSFWKGLSDALETAGDVFSDVKTADAADNVNANVTASAPETAQEPPESSGAMSSMMTHQNMILIGVAVLLVLVLLMTRGRR